MLEPPKPRTVDLLAELPGDKLVCITVGPGRRAMENFWFWTGKLNAPLSRKPITDVEERRHLGMTMTVGGLVLFYPPAGSANGLYWGGDTLERLDPSNYNIKETPARLVVMKKRGA